MQQYRPGKFSVLPPIIKNLLIINGLLFVATIVLSSSYAIDLIDILGLHYFGAEEFEPYQVITYMFMHGDVGHIFFNMFALWMFGNVLENFWGSRRFLFYYLATGVGAALTHYLVFYFQISPALDLINEFIQNPDFNALQSLVANHRFAVHQNAGEIWNSFVEFQRHWEVLQIHPNNRESLEYAQLFMVEYKDYFLNLPTVIGASGAVFGILLAFGMMFPNTRIYVYFLFPVKAKYFVIIYGALELIYGISGTSSNIAHFAHLGGMVFGFLLILFWKNKRKKF